MSSAALAAAVPIITRVPVRGPKLPAIKGTLIQKYRICSILPLESTIKAVKNFRKMEYLVYTVTKPWLFCSLPSFLASAFGNS